MPLSPAERQKRARRKRLKAGMVRLDLPIPRKLHRALRARAKKAKQPMNAMVIDVLTAEVS